MTEGEAALATLDAFVSVGAERFTITIKALSGEQRGCLKHIPADEALRRLPSIVSDATKRMESVIIRPYSDRTAFVQLDDVTAETVQILSPVGFIALRTSPGSYQAWIALESQGHEADLDFARRLKRGTGADENAQQATRCGGSRNFQEKHRASGFPVVAVRTHPGRITTPEALQSLGIVARAEPLEQPSSNPGGGAYRATGDGAWPRYDLCLQRAPRKASGAPDRSKADLAFAMTALSWGRPAHEIASRLSSVSARAPEWCTKYGRAAWRREVERTVANAMRFATPPSA
jgi:hypothetical protein